MNAMRNKLMRALKDPYYAGMIILNKFGTKFINSDEIYIKLDYFLNMKQKADLKNPKRFNEKLCWLKLYCKKPEYTLMVDKVGAKEYVGKIIGKDFLIPTLGVWERFEDIDFEMLPNKFVLKCSHDSGGLIICSDKTKLNINAARKKINKCLKRNYFLEHREYQYKDVKHRIIAEEYLVDESGFELKDYKFFCFNGEPKMLFIATDRPNDVRFDFFDINFNHLPFKQGHPLAEKIILKPHNFDLMVDIARKLSINIPHVRVDLYNVNGKVYFGELTFTHFSGNVAFEPDEWDYKIGEWLELPNVIN